MGSGSKKLKKKKRSLKLDFSIVIHFVLFSINPLSAKLTKWPNTLKQFVGNLPKNCLSVSHHFMGLALKGLIYYCWRHAELIIWFMFTAASLFGGLLIKFYYSFKSGLKFLFELFFILESWISIECRVQIKQSGVCDAK